MSFHGVYAQSNANNTKSDLVDKTMIPKLLQSLRKDITGHYSNPSFGIESLDFPSGWHGRAIETEFGLLVNMHPGNESQYLRNLLNRENPVVNPVILVQSLNNSVIHKLSLPTFSISKNCRELAANTTSALNGKTFQVYTIECPFSKLLSGAIGNNSGTSNNIGSNSAAPTLPKNFNTNGVGQTKVYEHKTPDRTYRILLVVSSPLFSSNNATAIKKPDISKYIPVIDATAKTLKLK
ncbi:MAG TPA: hypothetical protein VH796_19145 [Nitrososphaeraceae archaeon]|jgi:hypothetical protein